MPSISRARALAYAVAVLVALLVGARLLHVGGDRPESSPAGGSHALELEAGQAKAAPLVVHVVGAVARPGLYRLKDGSRVDDAIARAGGATGKAALELVNLAAPIADGQQIVVPMQGEAPVLAAGGEPGGAAGGRVHLNSATLEQLDTLPGVGPVTAQAILDYRTEKGAFQSVEELDAVPGIGPARLEQLKELVDL
jgi:competence protein ComEA